MSVSGLVTRSEGHFGGWSVDCQKCGCAVADDSRYPGQLWCPSCGRKWALTDAEAEEIRVFTDDAKAALK